MKRVCQSKFRIPDYKLEKIWYTVISTKERTIKMSELKEKINFYVPDFYSNAPLYIMLADFMQTLPQWFYDDFKISAAYGSFPNCIWNGGRVGFDKITRPVMDVVIQELNKRGIAVRYTFTNPLLEEKHMSDTFSNICLEASNNGMNEVLVNTQVIEDYVRANYPGFKIISSTTKCLRTIEEVERELEKDYYLVVLDSCLNKDERIFSLEGRDRLELLVDHGCYFNCPNSERHYEELGRSQLTFTETRFSCPTVGKTFEEIMQGEHSISRELMTEKYIPGGIKHFKLDGRSFQPDKLVDSLLYYMVKPQFRPKMKEIIKEGVYENRPSW